LYSLATNGLIIIWYNKAMKNFRWWAFWRRMQYGLGYALIVMLCVVGVYYNYFYQPNTCFDGIQNGDELAVDCGGSCVRICSFTVAPPQVLWAESFAVTDSQYNAVAYIENRNETAGTPELRYKFQLFDKDGLINEKSGTTSLPPNTTQPVFEGRIATGGRIPTYTNLEITAAEVWLPGASDRSNFRTTALELLQADSRPRLNATLQNDNLYGVNNVEVVATIFDARGTPLTASQTFIDNFAGRSQSNLVFTWPRPIAKTIRSCEVPSDIMIVLDRSGSMAADGGTPPEPLESAKRSAETFVGKLRADDQIGFLSYATMPSNPIERTLTKDKTSAITAIANTTMGSDGVQYTNMGEAIRAAAVELTSNRHRDDARKVMILFTDGDVTRPLNPAGERDVAYAGAYARTLAEQAKEQDITIYTIGFGDFFAPTSDLISRDLTLISDLASAPELSYTAPTVADLARVYSEIADSICEEGAARIDIVPKTGGGFPRWP
jgi:Mg-chelatase subunit ChlD